MTPLDVILALAALWLVTILGAIAIYKAAGRGRQ